MGAVQTAIVGFLKENNGKAVLSINNFVATRNFTETGIRLAIRTLISKGVIKKSSDFGTNMPSEYQLIGEFPVSERKPVTRRVFGGDLLQRAITGGYFKSHPRSLASSH